jgi:KUP system potassium uptake protein
VILIYGFMETPNIPRVLALLRRRGISMDIMSTSFFVGRRTFVPAARPVMPRWMDRLYIWLTKNAADPTDYFGIPIGRVVELGAQVTV